VRAPARVDFGRLADERHHEIVRDRELADVGVGGHHPEHVAEDDPDDLAVVTEDGEDVLPRHGGDLLHDVVRRRPHRERLVGPIAHEDVADADGRQDLVMTSDAIGTCARPP
jgi:hypothetical protein